MEKNQDIRKKLTASDISTKKVTTSFLMMPLRLETKFINNKTIEQIDEPERVYYVLASAWEIIKACKTDTIKDKIRKLHYDVDELDVLYKEDKVILINTLNAMKEILPEEAETRDDWDLLVGKVERVGSVDSMKFNDATRFLDRLEHHTKRLRQLSRKPPYNGKFRQSNGSDFSQTAKYKAGHKHLKQCLVFWQGIDSELKAIPFMNNSQKTRFKKLVEKWPNKLNPKGYDIYNGSVSNNSYVLPSVREAKERFDELVDYYNGVVTRKRNKVITRVDIKSMRQKFIATLNGIKIGSPLRYTTVAGLIMRYTAKAIQTGQRRTIVKKLKFDLCRTYMKYNEHCDFIKKLVQESPALNGEAYKSICNSWKRPSLSLKQTSNQKCLCVRIYPDDIAVTQTVKRLSKNEYLTGRDFWMKYIFATDEKVRQSLWLGVCDYFPAYRAAWIVKKTFPKEHYTLLSKRAEDFRLEKRSYEEFFAEVEENILNVFPMTYVDTDEREFTVPTTELLPDRFVLHAELRLRDGRKLTISRYGHKLPHSLQLGLDMNDLEHAVDEKVSNEDFVKLGGNIRWMTDYDMAEKMGMAITLPLREFTSGKDNDQYKFTFDSLYVLGVNEESEDECEKILTGLLESHMYSSDGYDLLKIGTPTNILSSEDEAYFDTSDEALVEKYKHQAVNCVSPTPIGKDEDMYRIERLFGLRESVLGNLKDPKEKSPNKDIHKAMLVNNILIDIVDNNLVKLFKRNATLREFLSDDVLARGAFPPVRIGNQPYGILPICDFKRLEHKDSSIMGVIKDILLFLVDKWNHVADNMTQYSGDGKNADDFLEAVGSTPVSSFFQKVTYVKQEGELLLKPSFFKFGGNSTEEGDKLMEEIKGIFARYKRNVTSKSIASYLDGYDQVPLVEDDILSDSQYTANMDHVDFTKIVEKVEAKLGRNKMDKAEIKRLVLEFFDLFSYRLDAWLMGLLNHKLHYRLASKNHRIGLGTFGWVFNLKEEETNSSNKKDEYILAPSINHALTGAVMRSAYMNRVETDTVKDYNLDVRLTSQRVRSAIRIIEGIQNGLALGTILGTDLERLMHEEYKQSGVEMDEGIFTLRKRYPMVNNSEVAAGQKVSDNDITVINGLSLLKDVKAKQFSYDGVFVKDPSKKRNILKTIIDKVQSEYDSLTDVVLSEAVYKLTQGEREAVDALIQSLNKEKNIPLPDVTEIPIASAQVDGNLVVVLNPKARTDESALLAKVEPKVEEWLQTIVRGTSNIGCVLNGRDGLRRTETMKGLGVSASELVYLSANKSLFVKYLTLKNWMANGEYMTINTEEADDDVLSFDEVEMTLDNLREMLAKAHALKNGDLVKETGLDDKATYATLQDMYDKTHESVDFICQRMSDIFNNQYVSHLIGTEDLGTAVPDQVVKAAVELMLKCFSMGQTTALDFITENLLVDSNTKFDDTREFYDAVKSQRSFFNGMKKIYEDIREKREKAVETVEKSEKRDVQTYMNAIRKMLVNNMLLVPSFQPDANVPLTLLNEQKKSNYFVGSDNVSINSYITEMSKVSEQMMYFHQIRMFQEFNEIDESDVVPMQIPVHAVADKRMWLGQEVESEEFVYDANTYLMVQPKYLPTEEDENPMIAAIVFDHWIERIPYHEQTAGLAFNYDQPDAEAPQTLLMAVSTKEGEKNHWSEKMLLRTIRSTMHLVKSRAVEPDDLREHPRTSAIFPLISYEDKISE